MHHLRSGDAQEWNEFPASAEGRDWTLKFDAAPNAAEQTLRLRHRDVKQLWTISLNGKELGKLPQDENAMVTFWPIPPRLLREAGNELRVAPSGTGDSDDVTIGDAQLLDAPRANVVFAATLDVTVTDSDTGSPLPCRITIADEQGSLISLGTPSGGRLAVRPGVVYTVDGHARLQLPLGKYTVYAGRGFEYSLASAPIDLAASDAKELKLSIRRVVPTPGYVACDTHVHTLTYSRHGDATIDERMITLAGEGIELPIATDHNLQIDYEAPAAAAGVRRFFTPVIGNEATTEALGHFNVFPIAKDAKLINWRVRSWESLGRSIAEVTGGAPQPPVVILNHARDIHGGFRPFDPSRHISLTGEDLGGTPPPADAMEVMNSGAPLNEPMLLFNDWLGMLNRGHVLTPIASSDSHDVSRYIVGQGRTYIRCDDADPSKIDVAAAVKSIREGRVLVSYGLLTEMTVAGKFGSGDLVPTTDVGNGIEVEVRVLGPEWTKATHLTLFANGVVLKDENIATAPGATEPAGVKWTGRYTLPRPPHDVHLVAIATGPGVAGPWWPTAKPYQPTSPQWTPYVLGSTGAVLVDADGSGKFECALDYAKRWVEESGADRQMLLKKLENGDQAIAAQVASLLRAGSPDHFEEDVRALSVGAGAAVGRGLDGYLAEWHAHEKASRK